MAKRLTTFSKLLITLLLFGGVALFLRFGIALLSLGIYLIPIIMVLFIFLIIIRMFAFNSHKKTQWQLLQFDIDDFEKSNDIDKQPVIIFGSEKLIKYLIKEMREHNFHILNATYYNGSKSVVAFHHNEKIANEKIKDIARYILKHGLSAAKRQVKNKLELTPPSEDLQLQRYQKTTQMIRENSHSRRL